MFRLFSVIYAMAGTTCAGIAVVISLVIGQDTLQPILIWAAAGALVGVPASWIIAKMMLANDA